MKKFQKKKISGIQVAVGVVIFLAIFDIALFLAAPRQKEKIPTSTPVTPTSQVFQQPTLATQDSITTPTETAVTTGNPRIPCSKLEVLTDTVTLYPDEMEELPVRVSPNNTTDQLTYHSMEPGIVSVDDQGMITAMQPGDATIEISCGGQRAKIQVSVQRASIYANGNGTPEAPYEIYTVEDLLNIQYDLTACYILKDSISDFGNEVKEFESIGQTLSSVQDWSLDKSFRGTFDGNGNGIYGFTILPNGAYCGLFTSIGKEGVVKNLNMSASMNPSESTDCTLVGGIAGYNEGTISNCIVKVTAVTPASVTAVGSVAAVNAGQIQSCQGEGEITANNQNAEVGGIAGINREGGTFDHCIALTKLTNSPGIRKLIGNNEAGNNTGDFRGYSVKQFDNSMFDAQGVCAMRITYDQIVLNGDTPAVQKINQQLSKDRENFLRPLSEDLKQNILSNAVYNPNSFHNTADAAIAYQSDSYLSICVSTNWYGGGVMTIDHYGLNFDLTTGNKATICMVTGVEWDALKPMLKQILADFRGRHFVIPDDALEQFKMEELPFFIQNGEIMIAFPTYSVAVGAEGCVIVPTGICCK